MRWFLVAFAALVLGLTAATFVVGGRLFEEKVVADSYGAGLSHDRDRRRAARVDCAISAGPCRKNLDGGTVVGLEIEPRPVRAMAELVFTVRAGRGALPAEDGEAEVSLSMPGMFMGEQRVRLSPAGGGAWRGKGTIVRCPSGSRTWSAEVAVRPRQPAAAPLRAAFTFDVAE